MVTPFTPTGAVNYDVASEIARYLVAQGSDGLVVAGSTGEGSSLTDGERLDLFRCVSEAVTVPVLGGTTDANTAHSVELTRLASSTGLAGILATTPAYARPNQAGIAGHLSAVARATHLPVMLYDIPSRTGRKIHSSTTIELVRGHDNIVALKDASADLTQAAATKEALGDGFDLYSGDDSLTLDFLRIGGVGVVSVAGHWASPEFSMMVNAALDGQWELAEQIAVRLAPSCAWEGTESYPNPMPSKAALRFLGYAVGGCRLPHGPDDVTLDEQAHTIVTELIAQRG
jgi:4-hydroxy-tetrahydrodipicolinate synthase